MKALMKAETAAARESRREMKQEKQPHGKADEDETLTADHLFELRRPLKFSAKVSSRHVA